MRLVCSLHLVLLWALPAARAEDVDVFARDLSARSGNIAAEYGGFDNLTLGVGKAGFMEWTVRVRGGSYYTHFYYASGERRPCWLSINGRELPGEVLAEPTSGFFATDLRWETRGPVELEAGENTIRLSSSGFLPHLQGLRVSMSRPRSYSATSIEVSTG